MPDLVRVRLAAVNQSFKDYLEQSRKADEVLRSDITLGLQFHDARMAMGLTQQELATRARAPQADISRIERGAGNPTEATLQRLARAPGRELVLV